MKKVAFLGSGEMARHIAHYMVEDNQFEIAGFYDDYTAVGTVVFGYKILGTLNDLENDYNNNKFDEIINAIGYTRFEYRKELYERFFHLIPHATFIHSTCLIDSTAKIGKGVVLFPFCILYLDSVIEDNVFIQVRSSVTDSTVKKHSMLSATVTIAGRSELGECCFLGVTTTVSSEVKICDNVTTGASTAVVKDITEAGLYVGVPARKIK